MEESTLWALLILGLMLVISGLLTLAMGDTPWRGTLVLSWTGWLKLALGIIICVIALRDAERRAKAKLREDAAKKAAENDVKSTSSSGAASAPPQAADNPTQAAPDKDSPHTS